MFSEFLRSDTMTPSVDQGMAGWAQDPDIVGPVADFWIQPVAITTRVYTAQGTLMIGDELTAFGALTEFRA
jgi:hypothetical protein